MAREGPQELWDGLVMIPDYRDQVAEATGANIFFVKDGVIDTATRDQFLKRHHPPARHRTRQAPRHLVIERAILPEKPPVFSKCFSPARPATISQTLMNDYMKNVYPAAVAAG
ncbi:hypothetical protein [Rhizobium lentis]|uniref:hypothetical protein n=1 Tax=Rhizobium lentis TaxID=1138194 RepID=UPI001C84046F|nr:hypothetical protein [Rhizobium lentis]